MIEGINNSFTYHLRIMQQFLILLFCLISLIVSQDPPGVMICDFIVVGGGTAGSFFAAEISSNPDVTVCVIDQGIDQSASPYTVPDSMDHRMSLIKIR
jgi:hypothetical protein